MKVEDALDDKQEKTSGNECPLKHTVLKSPFNLCGVLAMRLNPRSFYPPVWQLHRWANVTYPVNIT
jgi:hypothetical protein